MKLQKIKITILGLIVAAGVSACDSTFDDFLSYEPYSEAGLANKEFWESKENVQQAVDALSRFSSIEEITGRGILWYENCSDNLITGRNKAPADRLKNWNVSADYGLDINDTWPVMYEIIAQCNEIIKKVKDANLDTQFKNSALGAAYFYRGMAYLWLAPFYGDNGPNGGVPNITDETPVEKIDAPRPKSVLTNYDQIISDLQKAGELLPLLSQLDDSNKARPWKGAAWGLGARAAIYAAQYDAKYYDICIDFCNKVMGLTGADKRELFPDISKLFRTENNFSSEYLFSLIGSAQQKSGPKFFGVSWSNGGFGKFNTWGYFQPTLELYNAYQNGDKRRNAYLIRPGDHFRFLGQDFILDENQFSSSPSRILFYKYMYQYREMSFAGQRFYPDGNFMCGTLGDPVVRYADVLLMKAEALIWKNGEGNSEAKALIDAVRQRAGLAADSHATKAELKRERRCELAFEFFSPRIIDLIRWKDYDKLEMPLHGYDFAAYADNKTYKVAEVFPARKFDPSKNRVFPIPQNAIQKSKNLKQNIGY